MEKKKQGRIIATCDTCPHPKEDRLIDEETFDMICINCALVLEENVILFGVRLFIFFPKKMKGNNEHFWLIFPNVQGNACCAGGQKGDCCNRPPVH